MTAVYLYYYYYYYYYLTDQRQKRKTQNSMTLQFVDIKQFKQANIEQDKHRPVREAIS